MNIVLDTLSYLYSRARGSSSGGGALAAAIIASSPSHSAALRPFAPVASRYRAGSVPGTAPGLLTSLAACKAKVVYVLFDTVRHLTCTGVQAAAAGAAVEARWLP